MQNCALCKKDAELRKSHIIPEFLYQWLYEPPHRFQVISTAAEEKTYFEQLGIRERLLCHACEQRLNEYENYSAKIFNLGTPLVGRNFPDHTIYDKLEYRRFKLFQISMLWRFSIASHEFFRFVKLGPHEERLRLMLLQGNPREFWRYGVSMTRIMYKGLIYKEFTSQPVPIHDEVVRTHYRMGMAGFMWLFFVGFQPPPPVISKLFLQEDGSLIVMRRQVHELEFLREYERQLGNAGKLG